MSIHIFGAILTPLGTAANNRGLTEGNITTLQKIIWNGRVHTTISAESIRFALRRRLAAAEPTNRRWDEDARVNAWEDGDFKRWAEGAKDIPFIDDDLLGYMKAEGAKEEGDAGSAKVRRAVLEVSRAISLTSWPGDTTFNAASPGATPSAQKGKDKDKKAKNPVPYGTEMHATRYQYGFALTPERLRKTERAKVALDGLVNLGEVAGNHGRFLFDFSPDSIVLRISQDPAPRLLYTFELDSEGRPLLTELVRKVRAGDIDPKELFVGGSVVTEGLRDVLRGAELFDGVKAASAAAAKRLA